jgi:hypothetical protein
VNASEFAFLVLGLILGIPTGAALLVVLRARPSSPGQIRVTVAPDSVPRRRSVTLADDPFVERQQGIPARGGPADTGRLAGATRAGRTGPDDTAAPLGIRTSVLGRGARGMASADRPGVGMARDPETSAGFAVREGVDPVFASFQRAAATEPANAPSRDSDAVSRPEPSGLSMRVALRDAAVGARDDEPSTTVADVLARSDDRRPTPASIKGPAPGDQTGDRAATGNATPARAPTAEAVTAGAPTARAAEAATGPCAAERRAMTELCALAERMQSQADGVADRLRQAQRTYDTHLSAADQAEAVADPRVQRAAKDAAQHAFRRDRTSAASREEVEAAARTWLQEINRINGAAREAASRLAQERRAATSQVSMIERLTVEADAVRVQAEAAREACLQAREALAACEEAKVAMPPAARMPLAPSLAPGELPPSTMPDPEGRSSPATAIGRALRRPPTPEDTEADAIAASMARGERQPAILRLLAGDRAAFEGLVAALGGDDAAERRRWQVHLAGLVDALVARAIDACAFDFPEDHFFWGPFTRGQCRDIALALSSLGFRFDGLGGFADDRVPSQRDLSLAVGYAGLDPMRIRRWPTEAEMVALFRDVAVAADEYIAGAASGLTLGELVTLLGHRADGLTEVWNAWGRIRPRLLEPI